MSPSLCADEVQPSISILSPGIPLAYERRRISGCRFSPPTEKRQPEIRLRSQASIPRAFGRILAYLGRYGGKFQKFFGSAGREFEQANFPKFKCPGDGESRSFQLIGALLSY